MFMKKWIVICVMFAGCNGGSDPNKLAEIHIPPAVDVLFVVDNSGGMIAEQRQLGESMQEFLPSLESAFEEDYHIAVVTTGVASESCPLCDGSHTSSCLNQTGEDGRFQDRLGKNQGTDGSPAYTFEHDQTCRVVSSLNSYCLYDQVEQKGTLLVGYNGCGTERGLAAVRKALGDLAGGYNSGFLRKDAALAVVVVSTEEDCGEAGDVCELTQDGGDVCYYAAKGVGPEGETRHPDDPEQRTYQLTPLGEYRDFLKSLKSGKSGLVKFAAIVGVKHVNDLDTTTIEYEWNEIRWEVVEACVTSGCVGDFCLAWPGTRYIQMAQLFGIGENGFVDTICQTDFTDTMKRLGKFLSCPGRFLLSRTIADPREINLALNGEPIPRYSCSVENQLEACQYTDDPSCSAGTCVETWSYYYPSLKEPHGAIVFAAHFDACSYAENGVLRIELAER
jgi:hypothetical protein